MISHFATYDSYDSLFNTILSVLTCYSWFIIFFLFINLIMTVRDRQNWAPLKKERFWSVLFRAPLFLGK